MSLDLTVTFDGHRVRMVGTAERPEWVAKDVCFVLDIHNSRRALRDMVPEPEKGVRIAYTPGGPQEYATVTEAGLYRLVARSRKASAQRFQSWLFGEVLPSIRKHGVYPPPLAILPATREQQIATALLLAQEVISEKEATIARQDARLAIVEPKAEVFDACMSSEDLLTVAQVANILARPGRPLGEGRLFRFLRAQRILQGDNRPYQEHVEAGRFIVRETPVDIGNGRTKIHVQPLVTQRGVDYIRRRLDAADGQGSLLPARAQADPKRVLPAPEQLQRGAGH